MSTRYKEEPQIPQHRSFILNFQMDRLKRTHTVSFFNLKTVPVAGFELKLARKWNKYIYLYFLPAGNIYNIHGNISFLN